MVKDGFGGANTKTGLVWETEKSIIDIFNSNENYEVIKKNTGYYELNYKNEQVGLILIKYGLYHFLESKNIVWKEYISKKLLPDTSIFVLYKNTFFVIEMKYQEVAGSVDEKLQTCDFKRKQYKKLVSTLNWEVEFIFLLGEWFKKPEYRDVLDYIHSVNCHYYFNYIPLSQFGLKP